ncbi:hypothetical protein [Neoaquamicrobium sediminum]|uniref:hypothetical protein n=1 Tax=Neoaquamicrobium sediminum TaxID=1849104 RepID=UPI0015670583|nr:hypothetical protein [Mesorhizobium sediminum]NRC55176.1 hypothetical protein [Mesorhizobium sediminum]
MSYQTNLDRLSQIAEFLRLDIEAYLETGSDVTEMLDALGKVRDERTRLAMAENLNDFDAACIDLDASQARAAIMCQANAPYMELRA